MPLLVAAALAPGCVQVRGLPQLADIDALAMILRRLGGDVRVVGDTATVGPSAPAAADVPAELSTRLRGSVYALAVPAALLGHATSGPIGGDRLSDVSLRRRQLAPHVRAFAGFGMTLRPARGGWRIEGGRPRAGEFTIDDDGVSASALAALLAATAEGRSVVRGVSREIEVDDTLAALSVLGARAGRDGDALVVEGPLALSATVAARLGLLSAEHRDRIVGTLAAIGLPIYSPSLTEGLCSAALDDAARHRCGRINLPVPTRVGGAAFLRERADLPSAVLASALAQLRRDPLALK